MANFRPTNNYYNDQLITSYIYSFNMNNMKINNMKIMMYFLC